MLKMTVQVKGIEKANSEIKRRIQMILRKSMLKMEELAASRAPVDTGYLKMNISVFPYILADQYVLVSKAPYSADLEYGNTPRYVKISELQKWVVRKGIAIEGPAAYVIAKNIHEKIRKQGVNAQPFMRPAFYEVKEIWLPEYAKEEMRRSI